MANNYIAGEIAKLNKLAQDGTPSEKLLPVVEGIRELLIKNIEMLEREKDPNRLQPFGDPDPVETIKNKGLIEPDLRPFGTPDEPTEISELKEPELQPFGTPEEPSNKGMGSM